MGESSKPEVQTLMTGIAFGESLRCSRRARTAGSPGRHLTCHATRLSRPPMYEVLETPRAA
jgi:hypothetical protein